MTISRRTIQYDKELNEAQLEAVRSVEGPHLLIAGAGSGKTRVLVFRTAYLVEQGVSPDQILLLTFTRRSAREMLDRSSVILDDRCQKVSGGTFHSFANMILRKYGEVLGIARGFTILDQDDAENAVNLVRTQLGLHKADKRFPKKQALLSLISKSVNKGTDLEAVIDEEAPHFMEWAESIARIKEEYQVYKRTMGLLDYDDLLVYLHDLLAQYRDVREHLSKKYPYIMVDEYQDTNKIQAQIIRLLTCVHTNIMVVGDDAQSIYSFRGAHFRNIIDFPKIFPGAKIIKLEENYRSSQPILDLTNEVIRSAEEKFEKELYTNKGGDSRPVYVDTLDENSQSRYVVRKIRELLDQGVPLNEIAVLFRSGWHSNDLEVELAGEGIPFIKYGGQKFVEAAHIKDLMSYLRVAANPFNEVSWERVLMLLQGIGKKSVEAILHEVVKERKGFEVSEQLLQKRSPLRRLLELFRQTDAQAQRPSEILKRFMEFYYPILTELYDDYDKRLNDLESLEKIAARYDSLEEFLTDMALEPPEKTIVDSGTDRYNETHLVLSTIHSAKGLEWHTVFVLYLAEGYLPSYRSFNSQEAIEEERRLFYVAATRAKDNLYMLRPQVDHAPRHSMDSAGSVYTRISRFLGEGRILRRFVTIESTHAGNSPAWYDAFD